MWSSHNANGVLQGSALNSAQAQVRIPYSSYPSLVPGRHQSGVKGNTGAVLPEIFNLFLTRCQLLSGAVKNPAASHCTVKSPIGAVLIAARAVGALKLSASGS